MRAVQERLVDPVVAADGESYERGPMEVWLADRGAVSPITGQPLPSCHLTPNHSLRNLLQNMTLSE